MGYLINFKDFYLRELFLGEKISYALEFFIGISKQRSIK